jgi:hypothetical protein
MRWSLAQLLDAALPHLDVSLAAPRELASVRALLGSLPAALSDWIYLELRLAPRDPRIDLIARVDRAHRSTLSGNQWPGASEFTRTWASTPAWNDAIECLWLEFDFDGPMWREPRFFVDLAPSMRTAGSHETASRLALAALSILGPHAVPREIAAPVSRTLHALPRGGSLFSVGLPGSDGPPGVRVCLNGVTRRRLPAFLGAIEWRGSVRSVCDELGTVLEGTGAAARIGSLDLDVTTDGAGRLAIELAFAHRPQLRGGLEEQRLLENLVALGLAESSSIDALRAWPGCEIARLPQVLWPALLVRRLNHVKIVFEGDRIAAVKAYPCVFHRFAPRIAPRLYSIDRALDCIAPWRVPARDKSSTALT